MRAGNAISEVDSLWPNAYSTEQKYTWLSRCESTIDEEIVQRYPDAPAKFTGIDGDEQYALIAPEPYDQLYIYWLEAMVHYADGEITKYNNALANFNALFAAFRRWYGQKHGNGDGERFRF